MGLWWRAVAPQDGPSPSRGSHRASPYQPARHPCRRPRRHAARGPVAGRVRPGRPAPGRPAPRPDRRRRRPGDFTGYGFDQCVAPTQAAMDAWIKHSPFRAVGIYISGDSRACRTQPNLTPTWVATQLSRGWRLLPITLGPQASCLDRFPRYDDDFKIDPTPAGSVRRRPRARASSRPTRTPRTPRRWASAPAARCGTTSRASTSATPTAASPPWRSPARGSPGSSELGYVAGFYSSASSGIKMLDDARAQPPRPVRPAGPHLDRPLGRRRQHVHELHPRGRLAPGRPDEAVPRRPQRDLGRRHDQHRQQLPRPQRDRGRRRPPPCPRPRPCPPRLAGARDPLRRHAGRLPGVLHAQAAGGQPDPHPRAAVPAQGEEAVRRQAGRRLRPRRPGAPPVRG